MNSGSVIRKSLILASVTLCLAFAVSTVAQVQTQTSTTSGQVTKVVQVESGEVVAVEGNNLFVKMPDGSVLNRYYDQLDIPRQESYLQDVETGQASKEECKIDLSQSPLRS